MGNICTDAPDRKGGRPEGIPAKGTDASGQPAAVYGFHGRNHSTLRRNMYDRAFVVGRFLGRLPGRKSDAAKTRLIRWLYRNIDISIVGDMPGEISVPRCAFSDRYTPETCYVMSGMDAGIICGIFGGGEFGFRHRLTEGCPACKAAYRR